MPSCFGVDVYIFGKRDRLMAMWGTSATDDVGRVLELNSIQRL